jgi:hypothetical protein
LEDEWTLSGRLLANLLGLVNNLFSNFFEDDTGFSGSAFASALRFPLLVGAIEGSAKNEEWLNYFGTCGSCISFAYSRATG